MGPGIVSPWLEVRQGHLWRVSAGMRFLCQTFCSEDLSQCPTRSAATWQQDASAAYKSQNAALVADYWKGHENREMGTRYAKQLVEEVAWRKQWAKKAGLGFKYRTYNLKWANLRLQELSRESGVVSDRRGIVGPSGRFWGFFLPQ